jgi:hypothetical protein
MAIDVSAVLEFRMLSIAYLYVGNWSTICGLMMVKVVFNR